MDVCLKITTPDKNSTVRENQRSTVESRTKEAVRRRTPVVLHRLRSDGSCNHVCTVTASWTRLETHTHTHTKEEGKSDTDND